MRPRSQKAVGVRPRRLTANSKPSKVWLRVFGSTYRAVSGSARRMVVGLLRNGSGRQGRSVGLRGRRRGGSRGGVGLRRLSRGFRSRRVLAEDASLALDGEYGLEPLANVPVAAAARTATAAILATASLLATTGLLATGRFRTACGRTARITERPAAKGNTQ